jgi:hypothetical protein
LSRDKKQQITEEARKYVDAASYYQSLGGYIRSVQQRGYAEGAQTANAGRCAEIRAKQLEDIKRAIAEGQERISPPTIALNGLVGAPDELVYFTHHGQELKVVPKNDASAPHQRFGVERKDGGSWTPV